VKDWQIIADNLHNAAWSLGWVSALDREGRTIWVADAHRDAKALRFASRLKDDSVVELASPIRLDAKSDTQIVFPEES
jgi:hypothetical protein